MLSPKICLGQIIARGGTKESGPLYTIHLAGEEGRHDEPATDELRRALEYVIDHADSPDAE